MSVYSIHFSPTGGTRAVMQQLCAAWSQVTEIDLTRADVDYARYTFTAQDLCLVGVPSYGGLVPPLALQRLDAMRANGTPAVLVAVYGNREIEDTLTELEAHLLAAGFTVLAGAKAVAQHSLIPNVAVGRPDTEDIAQLREFSAALKAAAEAGAPTSPVLPGSRPAKEPKPGGMVPALLHPEACTHCGLCAARCPAQAIALQPAGPVMDGGKCAHCMRCTGICPVGALGIDPATLSAVSARLAPLFAGRKLNELYL